VIVVGGGLELRTGLETGVVTTVPRLMAFVPMTLTATVTMTTAVPARTARGVIDGTSHGIDSSKRAFQHTFWRNLIAVIVNAW
jgi:hypothetical protein